MKSHSYILAAIIFSICCKGPKKADDANAIGTTDSINRDSLISMIFRYSETYFRCNSIDTIVALNGTPKFLSKTPLGEDLLDSLVTVGYDFIRFEFWVIGSRLELVSVDLFDEKVALPGDLTIGRSTRQDILRSLGLPDQDHNDPGRSMTKSGDTTVNGTKSGAGDTVTFTYFLSRNADHSISLAMTKDTVRKMSWLNNPY